LIVSVRFGLLQSPMENKWSPGCIVHVVVIPEQWLPCNLLSANAGLVPHLTLSPLL